MKTTIIISIVCFATFSSSFAQEFTEKGNQFLQIGTNPFGTSEYHGISTSFHFSGDGFASGIEGGYFIENNLALIGGFGYLSNKRSRSFNYKIGSKYYLLGRIPLQLSYHISTTDLKRDPFNENPPPFTRDYVTFGIGYNIPISKKIYIEPYVGVILGVENNALEFYDLQSKLNFIFTF